LAARGQSISLAFYPEQNLVMWGSELGAIKAGLKGNLKDDAGAQRIDLDDLGGEVFLVDWGTGQPTTLGQHGDVKYALERKEFMKGRVTVTIQQV
jgi:hypothetical protein